MCLVVAQLALHAILVTVYIDVTVCMVTNVGRVFNPPTAPIPPVSPALYIAKDV